MAGRAVRADDALFCAFRLGVAGRDHRFADRRLHSGARSVRTEVLCHRRLEPGDQAVRRSGAYLRNAGDLVDRAHHRHSGELRHRAVPDRDVSSHAQASVGHRGRTARRDSQHHLWHVGPVRVRACFRRHRPAVPGADLGQYVADRAPVPGRAERDRHAFGRCHSFGHGHSVHRVGHARRVRDRCRRC